MTPPTCDDLAPRLDAIAAGDDRPDAVAAAHLASCAACARALAEARAIHALLASQPAPAVRPELAPRILTAVRRERWRAEQLLDLAFNVVVALALLVAVGGGVALAAGSGLASMGVEGMRLALDASREALLRAAPSLGVYVLAAGLAAAVLALWGWAEGQLEL